MHPSPAASIPTENITPSTPQPQPKEYFRVTLKRGLIGLPEKFKEHTRSLGLRHTHQKSYLQINPQTVGNILKVKELVEVKKVKGLPVPGASYWAKGYTILRHFK